MLVAGVALVVVFVFSAAFRFAIREGAGAREAAALPRAAVLRGGDRWLLGARKQRAVGAMRLVQAGLVALGITSVFVMVVCALGIVGLMIAG
jgi:hypothetical protein